MSTQMERTDVIDPSLVDKQTLGSVKHNKLYGAFHLCEGERAARWQLTAYGGSLARQGHEGRQPLAQSLEIDRPEASPHFCLPTAIVAFDLRLKSGFSRQRKYGHESSDLNATA
jgi:hypothetical protein